MDSLNRTVRCRRNILLGLAAGAFLLSLAAGPQPWLAMANHRVFIDATGFVSSGILASLAVSIFATVMGFDLSSRPWYGQKGGMTFALAAALCLDLFCGACMWLVVRVDRVDLTDSAMPLSAGAFLAIAAQLASVALISWPSWLVPSKWSSQVPNSKGDPVQIAPSSQIPDRADR